MNNQLQNELTLYADNVKDKAARKEDYLFHNEGNAHAKIILENLFRNADSHIRIAANTLNNEVVNSSEYMDAMKCFLDKDNTRLDIIVTQIPRKGDVNMDDSLYGLLLNHHAYNDGRITVKSGEGKSFRDKDGERVNFCTGDDMMFRLEDNIEARTAVANFNNPDTTRTLINTFDGVFNNIEKKFDLNDLA